MAMILSVLSAVRAVYPSQLLTCPISAAITTTCMSTADYDNAISDVQAIYDAHSPASAQADFAGCVVRLAGHDLMDYNPSAPTSQKGGADGCLDFTDPDNAGLQPCLLADNVLSLKTAYHRHCHQISLADFIVIAAEAVIAATADQTSDLASALRNSFRYGRTTSLTCDWAPPLPNPEESCQAVREIAILPYDTIYCIVFDFRWRTIS